MRQTLLLRRPSVVNLAHDPLSPLNRSRNHGVGSWTALRPTKQVVSRVQVPSNENPCHDCQNALAAFIHNRQVYHIRYLFAMEHVA